MNQPQLPIYNQGTILTVGSHQVKVIKYLTSGGFAQIYKVEIQPMDPFLNTNIVCLKRVIVPDKASLNILRAEVDAMKLLRNNKHVVSYIDSHAAKFDLSNGSYEVFLLMEYCQNGGLIDFMNTRLQTRLHESEVLSIMLQVSIGVAAMHALQPPLLHRDIKIENVLIADKNEYKLCDFGSVCGIIRPPRNQIEFNYVQHDILKNTTAQYRSPEMVDLSRNLPIDEKSDIWALGVFLYKICYYTTPFEKEGENALLSARFQFPSFPIYSNHVKNLIYRLLSVSPMQRPNIVHVVEEVANMLNIPCPIVNFYEVNSNNNHIDINYTTPNLIHTPQLNSLRPTSTVSALSIGQYGQKITTNTENNHFAQSNKNDFDETHPKTDLPPNRYFNKFNRPISSSTSNVETVSRSNLDGSKKKLPLTIERISLSPVSNFASSTSLSNTSSLENEDEVDDKIIESINKPIRNNMVRGRRSVSIVKEENNEDPFANETQPQSKNYRITNEKDLIFEQKELSKDDVKKKMLAKLSQIGTKKIQKVSVNELKSNKESFENKIDRYKQDSPKNDNTSEKKNKRPIVPKKPEHLRPQKPKKPAFLIGKKINEVAGSTN